MVYGITKYDMIWSKLEYMVYGIKWRYMEWNILEWYCVVLLRMAYDWASWNVSYDYTFEIDCTKIKFDTIPRRFYLLG